MSAATTDCRVPDPSDKLDAKADGQFQAVNRRAGYGDDRLDRIIATARKGWTLAAGEGLVLVQEIDRLRAILAMLKKPDIDVLAAAMTAWSRTGDVPAMLHTALTTAEREVANDEG